MKKIVLFIALLMLVLLAVPALAQESGEATECV